MKLYDKSNDVLLIRPNGDVKFDCIAPFKIGNLKEETLQDIWNKKENISGNIRKCKTMSTKLKANKI